MYLQGDSIWYLPVSPLAVTIKQKSSGPFNLLLQCAISVWWRWSERDPSEV